MKKFIVILVIVALLTLLIVLCRHTSGTITTDDLCCPANPVNQMLHVVGLL